MIDFFSKSFIFADIPESDIKSILGELKYYEVEFSKSDVICFENCENTRVGFVRSGECTVSRLHGDGALTPINVLVPGACFGILSVFERGNDFPTTVVSNKPSMVVFIDRDDFMDLMKRDSRISFNVARFLADRVAFLNHKLRTFSSGTVTEKLASLLLCEYERLSSKIIDLNIKRTAETLNTGRASLYRAIDKLVLDELLEYKENKIIIKDLEGLRRTK